MNPFWQKRLGEILESLDVKCPYLETTTHVTGNWNIPTLESLADTGVKLRSDNKDTREVHFPPLLFFMANSVMHQFRFYL